MSTRKGDPKKKGQKYQNAKGFRNDLHDKNKQAKSLSSLVIGGVCAHCKETIEWKIKYQKYKPLSVPKKCVLCQQKAVKRAYYTICEQCAQRQSVCAKCGRGGVGIVESFPQSDSEQASEEAEFRFLLKQMTEREKRTFLRQQAMASATPPSHKEEEEVLGGGEQMPLSGRVCEEGSDRDGSVQSDDGEESGDVSESSDNDDRKDRLQGVETMCAADSLLEHSGSHDLL